MAVTVTYTHGYQTIPGPIRAVCLMAASRTIVNPDGLLRQHLVMGLEAVDTFYGKSAAATTIDLSDVELRLLNPYRRSTWP